MNIDYLRKISDGPKDFGKNVVDVVKDQRKLQLWIRKKTIKLKSWKDDNIKITYYDGMDLQAIELNGNKAVDLMKEFFKKDKDIKEVVDETKKIK